MCTSQVLGPFTSSKDCRACCWNSCVFSVSCKGLSACRVQCLPLAYPSPITSCWLFGNLWTKTFLIMLSMFWATCTLVCLGFLRASVFTVPNLNSFSVALHISVQDVAVDCSSSPSCTLVRIKASNTDPTWIYKLAWATALSARWRPWWGICPSGGMGIAHWFFCKTAIHSHVLFSLTGFGRLCQLQA